MIIAGAAATLFMSPESLEKVLEIPQMANLIGGLAPLLVSVCVSMTYITACSVSLEGKNLWILKAAPVNTETIFLSKIAVNLTVTLPAVFMSGILFSIGLKLSLAEIVVLLVLPTVYSLFTAVAGLLINLALPNLDWTMEVTVIKQSAASMVAVFGGILVVVPPAALIFVLPEINPIFTNTGTIIVVSVITLFLYRYLITGGSKMFQKL
jgi:ABC-2 type transport system permease protein